MPVPSRRRRSRPIAASTPGGMLPGHGPASVGWTARKTARKKPPPGGTTGPSPAPAREQQQEQEHQQEPPQWQEREREWEPWQKAEDGKTSRRRRPRWRSWSQRVSPIPTSRADSSSPAAPSSPTS